MNERTRRLIDAAPGIVAVATLGVVALLAIFGFGSAVPVAAVVGWLLLTPLSAILGDVFLPDEDESESDADAAVASDEVADESDPVERLRRRYAAGDIDEAEFERRLDVLLETEGADAATARKRLRDRSGTRSNADRERELDYER